MESGPNFDLGFEAPDFSSLDPLEPMDEVSTSDQPIDQQADADAHAEERPYHTKRPHKKSRGGCRRCRARKVKCDETRPSCRACTLRRETCAYPPSTKERATAKANGSTRRSRLPLTQGEGIDVTALVHVPKQPQWHPSQVADMTDMRMLWFYTTEAYSTFAAEGTRGSVEVEKALKIRTVEHAFKAPFLMQCILGISAVLLGQLGQEVDHNKLVAYQARTFEGYRDAIAKADPEDFPALLACSLFVCALSAQTFREPDKPPLHIINWMALWRGISVITDIISPQSIKTSGLAVVFYRPPVDMEKGATRIPNNLLFMVSSINPGDADYRYQQIYYDVLKLLGSLYLEAENGFGTMLEMRIITFFTFVSDKFVTLCREYRPRALIMLAYYLAFAKLDMGTWWLQNISDQEIDDICGVVPDDWSHYLEIPKRARNTQNRREILRILVENNVWSVDTSGSKVQTKEDYQNFEFRAQGSIFDKLRSAGSKHPVTVTNQTVEMKKDVPRRSGPWPQKQNVSAEKARLVSPWSAEQDEYIVSPHSSEEAVYEELVSRASGSSTTSTNGSVTTPPMVQPEAPTQKMIDAAAMFGAGHPLGSKPALTPDVQADEKSVESVVQRWEANDT